MAATTSNTPGVLGEHEAEINQHIQLYISARVPEFRRLTELREKGWNNPAGDKFFENQRRQADKADDKQAQVFFKIMVRVGREIHSNTAVFDIKAPPNGPPRILDMCAAPGAFLLVAKENNPRAHVDAFSLPSDMGGHKVLLRSKLKIDVKFLDVTMLAADVGVESIPPDHPDFENFLPRHFQPHDVFDLVICDGQVLRTHQREPYREKREALRLRMTQLVIGLEHMRPGGTMLVLLHRIELWMNVLLLRTFCKFSSVQVYKPNTSHAKRSSFYMVASNIQSRHEDAIAAVETWKQLWKSATFDSEEECSPLNRSLQPEPQELLDDFGPRLVELGREVWATQARGLAGASFIVDS
ncbi:hypothetical protein F5Y14DRAFT_433151 [Nemania sp. NC0429]|nr:hypothetical protein F5Y14DRAFT_433151 [Nemania sp. NC0429]